MLQLSPMATLLDRFIPDPDLQIRYKIMVRAPAVLVLETARTFDLQSTALVRAIFWLRGRILGAKAAAPDWSLGFVQVMLRMGWGVLAEEPNRLFVAGTVCRPWLADVVMTPIPLAEFAAYSEPDQVKIIWTLEAEPLGAARSRFATETRAVGTDGQAQAKFRRYRHRFGIGIAMIRWLLLPAIRREAERRWRADEAAGIPRTPPAAT
jgi:hypothetical protein